jgi:RimJ/RimL family protein N-acetyltransferase
MILLPDWQPRPLPDGRSLEGRYVRLARFDAARDGAAIFDAMGGEGTIDEFARWMMIGTNLTLASFTHALQRRDREQGFVTYSVFPENSKTAKGMLAYICMRPEHGAVELGAVAFGEGLARSRAATETVYLMARHIFEELGYRRLEWKCNNLNEISKRAALRFGFAYEGIFRNHLVVNGVSRDSAWYAMTCEDWSQIKPGYERWLEKSNFDSDGQQKRALALGK